MFDGPPALAPRPGENDSPTPALPPKGKGGPPKRPPPPRRPPPPKAGPAVAEPEEPFGAPAASEGFADFSAFDSQVKKSTLNCLSRDLHLHLISAHNRNNVSLCLCQQYS